MYDPNYLQIGSWSPRGEFMDVTLIALSKHEYE